MIKFLLATLLFSTLSQAAEEVVLLDLPLKQVTSETQTATQLDSSFKIDFERNEVFGKLSFERYFARCTGHGETRDCSTSIRTVKEYQAKIEDMTVVEDQLIIHTASGEVECGVVKPGRIFSRARKLFLNGKCSLQTRKAVVASEERFQFFLVIK